MKIAIASDIYYPMTNGVAVFAHNLANGLAQAGHEVLVIAPSFTGEYHEEIDEKTGVKTVHLSSIRFPFYPDQINPVPESPEFLGMPLPRLTYKNGIWWTVNPWVEVKKVLDEFQPDVIHLQTAEFIALAVMSYVKKRNVPLVSTGHAYPDNITDQLFFLQPKPLKKLSNAILKAHMMSFLKNSEYATMPTEIAIGDLVPKNRKYFIKLLILLIVFLFGFMLAAKYLLVHKMPDLKINYMWPPNSVIVFLISLVIFVIFTKISIIKQGLLTRIIKNTSPHVLGVYLFHDSPYNYVIFSEGIIWLNNLHAAKRLVPTIILISLAFFMAGLVISIIKKYTFDKIYQKIILKVDKKFNLQLSK